MGFRKESDLPEGAEESTSGANESGLRRSFNIEDLQHIDPTCRDTVSINLSAGGFSNAEDLYEANLEISETPDPRAQTLIQTGEFTPPQTLIRDVLPALTRRRGVLKVLAVGIIAGCALAVTVTFSRGNATPATTGIETASLPSNQSSAEQVSVETDMFTVPQSEMQDQITVQESVVVPESGIIEYASSQPVQIAPRQFLYVSGTQRAIGATLAAPEYVPQTQSKSTTVSARNLKKTSENGRYTNEKDGSQWQGNWQLNTPAKNISNAESYSSYAKSQGASSLNSLRVIQQPKNSLLKSARGTSLKPQLSR